MRLCFYGQSATTTLLLSCTLSHLSVSALRQSGLRNALKATKVQALLDGENYNQYHLSNSKRWLQDSTDSTFADAATTSPTVSPYIASDMPSDVPTETFDLLQETSPDAVDTRDETFMANANMQTRQVEPLLPPTEISIVRMFSTNVELDWESPVEDEGLIDSYLIYDRFNDTISLVGTTNTTRIIIANLPSNSFHSLVFEAVSTDGRTSELSEPFNFTTHTLVDNFMDQNEVAEEPWGVWDVEITGSGSTTNIEYDNAGYIDTSLNCSYTIGQGEDSSVNVVLSFDNGQPVNIDNKGIIGIQFMILGTPGTSFVVMISTNLNRYDWFYYSSGDIVLSEEWRLVTLYFDSFRAVDRLIYEREEGLRAATGIVFRNDNPGTRGYISIDNVDFITRNSVAALGRQSSASTVAPTRLMMLTFAVGTCLWTLLW